MHSDLTNLLGQKERELAVLRDRSLLELQTQVSLPKRHSALDGWGVCAAAFRRSLYYADSSQSTSATLVPCLDQHEYGDATQVKSKHSTAKRPQGRFAKGLESSLSRAVLSGGAAGGSTEDASLELCFQLALARRA